MVKCIKNVHMCWNEPIHKLSIEAFGWFRKKFAFNDFIL